MRTSALALGLCASAGLAFGACKRPPPAPEGLDDSARFMYREFYADDLGIGAGLTGFLNWFDDEGHELLGQSASLDNAGAFSLADLRQEDVDHLPIAGDGLDLTLASGIVALAEMDCSWRDAEELLVRHDQEIVFEKDFDTYERTYLSSREVFETAADDDRFASIPEPLEPFAPDFDLDEFAESMLVTSNVASSTELGVTLEFGIELTLRHGTFEVQGEPTEAVLIETFLPERAEGDGGNNSFEQSYSVEVNVQRPSGTTLRMLANWVQIESLFVDSDSALVAASAVNKAQDAAARLSQICAGELDVPAE